MTWGRSGGGIADHLLSGFPPPLTPPHVHAEHGFAMTGRGIGAIPYDLNVR